MTDPIGRGMLGSIRRRANYEVRQLARANRQAQLARYSVARRFLRFCIGERKIFWFLLFYLLVCVVACFCEGYVTATHPAWLPGWVDDGVPGRLKDFGGFLITAQVGLLAVVSVAVGVVTFIAQRDDRTSTTEVGLYYTESLSYEIVASSSALLLVLCVQLFWPLQDLLHILGYGGRDMVFAVSLTVLHACWLALNVLLFSQFLLVTLRFVEPKARERMRKRFTANIITPNYNRANLLNMLYMHAPGAMVPDADSKKGTYITFGYGAVSDDGEVEIETDFRRPTKLYDVWTRPLGIVLRRWHARSVKSLDADPKRRHLFGGNLIALALRLGFESVYDQPFGWAVRLRGSPLQDWEKWVIRHCYRFRRFHDSELALPTPTTLLEELLDRVTGQIDRLTQVGFKSALFEAADYHRFLLETQDTVDDKGQPLNFSQIGGYFQRPYEEWVRQYRRVIEKAVEKIGIDNYFVNYMSHIIVRLLPRSAVGVATPTVVSLLDIGAFEVSLLERWFISATSIVTRDGAERRELPGSSQRAFEEVIDDFVGAWETVLKSADALYDWRMSKKEDNAAYWKALTNSWPYLRQHLYTSAYFVASAVWNEDPISTARYRDMLVRWQDSVRFDDRGEFLVKKRQLLAPDLFALDWDRVSAHSESFKQYPGGEPLQPETLVRMALRNGFADALLVSAAVLLQWHMQEKSDLSAETAADLVFRRAIEADGSRLGGGFGGEDIHRSLWGLVARYALTKRGDGSYTSGLDGMVRRLSGMAERRMISGRVYSSVGLDGVEAIAPQILIILAATLPEGDDQSTITWFREIAEAPESLPEGDASLRHLIWNLQAYERYWTDLAGTDGLAAYPLLQQAGKLLGFTTVFTHLVTILVLVGAWFIVVLSFFILAVQLFITILEFKLTTLAGFVLVPFALWGKTAFLAERVLGNVISSGIKVMVLAVIVGIGTTFFSQFISAIPAGQDVSLQQAMTLVLASLSLFGLGIFGPGIATGLVSGAPQLGAGAAVGTAGALVGTTALAGAAAHGAARSAAGAGKGAIQAGSALGGGAAMAYQMGRATSGETGAAGVAAGLGGVAAAGMGAARRAAESWGGGIWEDAKSRAKTGGEAAFRATGGRRTSSPANENGAAGQSPGSPASAAPPAWARRMQSEGRRRGHTHATTQAIKEGDRPGAAANPDLDQKEA